jgi:Pyruvate/2-oxoacid:ferredoxin oxidoreductase gamma subunit
VEREILLTGIGGQGIQLAAQVLARAAVASGLEVMLFGSYGGTMRGGPTDSTLVVADAPVTAPPIVSRAWSAIAMHPAGWDAVASKLTADAVVVRNEALVADIVAPDGWRDFALDATPLAAAQGGALAAAMVLVGAYVSATGIVSFEALREGLTASLPARRAQHRETNENALRAGYDAVPRGVAPAWPSGVRVA